MSHVGEKHWADGMSLLLGIVSVGFPSGQCACCKHMRNELLTCGVQQHKGQGQTPVYEYEKTLVQALAANPAEAKAFRYLTGWALTSMVAWCTLSLPAEEGSKLLQYIYGSMSLYLNWTHVTIALLGQVLQGLCPELWFESKSPAKCGQ